MANRAMSRRQLLGGLTIIPVAAGALDPIFGRPIVAEQQVHMQAAKDALTSAIAHLEQATPDKGGHRVAAMKAAKSALEHVEKGIRFDRRN